MTNVTLETQNNKFHAGRKLQFKINLLKLTSCMTGYILLDTLTNTVTVFFFYPSAAVTVSGVKNRVQFTVFYSQNHIYEDA